MGGYEIKNLYQGGYSTFSSKYDTPLSNYKTKSGDFGMTTDPRSANVLQDVSTKLNMGVKQIEITAVNPALFDAIPEQQLTEINRLSKLTGINVSIHGPVMDSAGINQQGFSELNRENSERRIAQVLQRSTQLNPKGNVPVVFHSSEGIMGSEWKTLGSKDKPREAKMIIAIDRETGQMTPLREEKKFYPDLKKGGVKEELYSPEVNLEIVNKTKWDDKIDQLFFNQERADEILQKNQMQIAQVLDYIEQKNKDGVKLTYDRLTPAQQQAYSSYNTARTYLDDVNRTARGVFSKAYEFGEKEQQAKLKVIADEYKKELDVSPGNPIQESKAMHNLLSNLKTEEVTPTTYVPVEQFATEQSAKTFGNAALSVYKNIKDKSKAPILLIENPPAGMGLSTGEDLKNLVVASRKQFVEKAVKEGVLSESAAKKEAEKLIGETGDVGHINMLRKEGFDSKDIIKETEKIAPFVKHVHLSDNFGFEHTELPMGMGNVPMKEIMDKLGQNGFDAKKIVEAASWWEHFKSPPMRETLEAFGSPIYSMKMGSSWNKGLGFYQDYYPESGATLPAVNYETFGSNFSKLPMELGGQRQGAEGNRMSGRGME